MICNECYPIYEPVPNRLQYEGTPGTVLCPLHEATADLLEVCKLFANFRTQGELHLAHERAKTLVAKLEGR